ncbi:unnamed protein product [Caenorhabditis sp. 36 PRJEB53466]|nr:unnamed protein product [Caenorhabditis sp. 36 PRJEB53466]
MNTVRLVKRFETKSNKNKLLAETWIRISNWTRFGHSKQMSYGPQLPGWLNKNNETESDGEEASPPVYGPVIPGQGNTSDNNKTVDKVPSGAIGPSIPSGLFKREDDEEEKQAHVFGPMIPKMVTPIVDEEDVEDEKDLGSNTYGPSIPSNFRPQVGPAYDESDEDIGPMPVSKGNEEREALERAYRLALQKETEEEEKNAQPKREEWMTSVPKKLGNFGLGARTFKKGTASERDSTWEDAPGAKKKRKDEQTTVRALGLAAADARQAAIVAEKTAGPSLLELHQKKRDDKVKDAGLLPGERRPFDREKDMEVRGLKPGGSKEAVDRMKEFTSRFANSKEQRFL